MTTCSTRRWWGGSLLLLTACGPEAADVSALTLTHPALTQQVEAYWQRNELDSTAHRALLLHLDTLGQQVQVVISCAAQLSAIRRCPPCYAATIGQRTAYVYSRQCPQDAAERAAMFGQRLQHTLLDDRPSPAGAPADSGRVGPLILFNPEVVQFILAKGRVTDWQRVRAFPGLECRTGRR